jgi:hypothetical protein
MLLIFGLMFGAVASAEAKKKAKKPVSVTYYFHGTETVGEIDLVNNFAVSYLKMDSTEPTEPAPRSRPFTTWSGDPQMWNDCAGSALLPVWTGPLSGKVVGDMKVTLHTLSAPKAVTIQVWPDLASQACASNNLGEGDYPEPAAETTVDLPAGPGESEIILKNVKFDASAMLMLQVLPHGPAPGRVLYDSPDFASKIEFKCIPKSC